jgi:hypothetical protein
LFWCLVDSLPKITAIFVNLYVFDLAMSGSLQFEIPLFAEGDHGASFRLRNKPGEIQRGHIIQQGSDLIVQGDLFSVVHGFSAPGGDPATLLVIDFRFTGSLTRSTRFKAAKIEIKFTSQGESPDEEPVVRKIAPHGTFCLDSSTETVSTTLSVNASGQAGTGPATLGMGASWERAKTGTRQASCTLTGILWIDGNEGHPNTGRWQMSENPMEKQGIPSLLRAAILVTQCLPSGFQALISVHTEVNLAYAMHEQMRRFTGGRVVDIVDPVIFDSGPKRQPAGAQLAGVDSEHLEACDLEQLVKVQHRQTRDTIPS